MCGEGEVLRGRKILRGSPRGVGIVCVCVGGEGWRGLKKVKMINVRKGVNKYVREKKRERERERYRKKI